MTKQTRKTLTALGAFGAFGATFHLLGTGDYVGFYATVIGACGVLSAFAISLIALEWTRY